MLKAKFRPPKLQDVVERPRVIDRMSKASASKSIWIAGAPGAGKTTATLQYLESTGVPYFWYRLDQEDSTPAGFFESAKALTEGLGRSLDGLPSFTLSTSENIFRFAQSFFSQLFENWQAPFYCIIDDYPDVPSESVLHRLVATAIGCLPSNCHIIVLSRNLPKGDLVRLLVNRDIALIDKEEILFDADEMSSFLKTNGVNDGEEIKKISHQAKGWVAGVILLLHGKKNMDLKSVPVETDDHQMLFEYFAREEYRNYHEELKTILKLTAYIPQFSVKMAEELVGLSSIVIEEHLSEQHKAGHFIEKRDVDGVVKYQYHPLYRHFLKGIGQQEISPDEHTKILLKASKLAIDDNQVEVAASLMAGAQDWDNLIKLCIKQSNDVLGKGRSSEFLWWVNKIPDEKKEKSVRLLLSQARALHMENHKDASKIYHKAFELSQLTDDVNGVFTAWAGVAMVYTMDWGDLHRIDNHLKIFEKLKNKYPECDEIIVKVFCMCAVWWCVNWRTPEGFDFEQLEKNSIGLLQENKIPSQRLQLCSALMWHYALRGKSHYTEYVEAIAAQDVLQQSIDPFVLWNANNTKNLYFAITAKLDDVIAATAEAEFFARKWSFPKGGLAQFEMAYTHLLAGDAESAKASLEKISVSSVTKILENAAYQVCEGWYLCEVGEYEKAIPVLQAAEKNSEKSGYILGVVICNYLQIFSHAKTNKKELSIIFLNQLKKIKEKMFSKHLELKILLAEAWLSINAEEPNEDVSLKVNSALVFARKNGIINYFGKLSNMLSSVYGYALSEKIETEYVLKLIGLQRIRPDDFGRILPDWPWPVRVTTLGEFSITVNNQLLDLSRQSARPLQLLKFLISRARTPISVPELIESLWPELDGEKGANNYKVTLSRLRKLIGKESVIQNDSKLSLSRSHCWIDAWVVQGLVKRTEVKEFWIGKQLNRSHQLLELCKGAFLPNESDYWLVSYRNEIHKDYLSLLSAVTEGFVENKDFIEAIELGQKGLSIDDVNEPIYVSMMTAYDKLNQKDAAKHLYEQYQQIIQSRYNIEPSQDIKHVYHSIIG
ncbi:MAG: hypothetical protein K6L75_15945 [Cellvibrionaceae bacterium]